LPGSIQAVLTDRILGASINQDQVIVWGISLKSGQEGQLLFKKTWTPPSGNLTLAWVAQSLEDGIFVITARETRLHYAFSVNSGELLWSTTEPQPYMDQYLDTTFAIAYGKLFSAGWGGIVYCYDATTGKTLWTYAAKDKYAEYRGGNNWALKIAYFADNKIYVVHSEHSPNQPLPRGPPFFCLDVETGEEVWSINIRATAFKGTVIGDSLIAIYNANDELIYGIGKGPSKTTIAAPDMGVAFGSSVVIHGMVTDVSSGTEDYARTARFPNGVPAVSDDNMSAWMEYVYMQKSPPTNVIGVTVTIDVLDSNNNYRSIGTATTDADGFFSFQWQPDIPGKYTVYASFGGSKSYWPSHAEAAFAVDEAVSAATPEPTQAPATMSEQYFLPAVFGIIASIAVVGALMLLQLRKK
jgi:outer membrane protein assembly factor BamB